MKDVLFSSMEVESISLERDVSMRHEFWIDSGILWFRILYILPVQFLTRALTESSLQ